jgi:hypothetical protein
VFEDCPSLSTICVPARLQSSETSDSSSGTLIRVLKSE